MSYTKLTSIADLLEYLTRLAEEFIKQDMLEVAVNCYKQIVLLLVHHPNFFKRLKSCLE